MSSYPCSLAQEAFPYNVADISHYCQTHVLISQAHFGEISPASHEVQHLAFIAALSVAPVCASASLSGQNAYPQASIRKSYTGKLATSRCNTSATFTGKPTVG